MIPIPIRKVLSSFQKTSSQALMMGGQACILYGAAEFSRDIDFAVLADTGNFSAIQAALDDLQAERVYVPPFELGYLERGHAVHFRCRRQDVQNMRIDIMSKMRGVDPFSALWTRRTTIESEGDTYDLLALQDLVQAKKTQRDKDWPMIRRLVDRNYFTFRGSPSDERLRFWLGELRTAELLVECAKDHVGAAESLVRKRPLLSVALSGDVRSLEDRLDAEEKDERARDREYWQPLRKELESLRHERARQP